MNSGSSLVPKTGSVRKTTDCNCSSCQLFGRELTIRDIEDGQMTISGLDDPAQLILKQDIVDLLNAYSEHRLPSSAHFRVKRVLSEADEYIKNAKEEISSEYRRLSVEHGELKERLNGEIREHRERIDAERIENNQENQRIRATIISEYANHQARMKKERLEHNNLILREVPKIKAYPWLVAGLGITGASTMILGIMLFLS